MNIKKVRNVLKKTLALNTKKGTVCNVMFRGESSCFRTRLRTFLQKWVEEKGFFLVVLSEDELDWTPKIQSRELFEEMSRPNTVVLVEQYATALWACEDNPHNFLRAIARERIYGCGNGWCPDDDLPNVLFLVAINDVAKLHWDARERATFCVWGERDLK